MRKDKGVTGGLNAKLPAVMGEGYLRKDVAPILDVCGRTIQHYTDLHLVVPEGPVSGKGTKRRYSIQNIFEMLIIQALLKHGINLSEMKPIIQRASEAFEKLSESEKKGKKLILILYTLKSDQDKTEYRLNLTTDVQFDIVAKMREFDSILILDISKILQQLNLI